MDKILIAIILVFLFAIIVLTIIAFGYKGSWLAERKWSSQLSDHNDSLQQEAYELRTSITKIETDLKDYKSEYIKHLNRINELENIIEDLEITNIKRDAGMKIYVKNLWSRIRTLQQP